MLCVMPRKIYAKAVEMFAKLRNLRAIKFMSMKINLKCGLAGIKGSKTLLRST